MSEISGAFKVIQGVQRFACAKTGSLGEMLQYALRILLPLPYINTSHLGKIATRGGVGGQFPRNRN